MGVQASGRPVTQGRFRSCPARAGWPWKLPCTWDCGVFRVARRSLAQLLVEYRGHRNLQRLPPLSIEQILAWADAHFLATGGWPTADSGKVTATEETWRNVSQALRLGLRKLTGGSSLAQLLAEQRGIRNRKRLPKLHEDQILAWATAHYARTGHWPKSTSGPIVGAPGETWLAVDMALRNRLRGLPGASSLARLLAERAGSLSLA